MNAAEKFVNKFNEGKHICVGLDTDIEKIPSFLLTEADPVFIFNKMIIEHTANQAASYKINLAFYETNGIKGIESLDKTLEVIPDNIPVIGDAKRGDIGNTAKMYAKALFEYYNFDASTLNPLMGRDSVQPFLDYGDKINFLLGLTSNSGADDFEKLKLENGKFLFQEIIEKTKTWGENVGFVFGATNLSELRNNIDLLGDSIVLLPGIGAQGGSLEDVVGAFREKNFSNFIINISRGLIYLDSTNLFAVKAGKKLEEFNNKVAG
jgi:orotidine-5'-phosphate decarboxylase